MLEHGIPAAAGQSRAWLITFTDLVSLMLTFFVMLFSMSNVQVDRWDDMIDALSRSLNPSKEKVETSVTAQYNISSVFRKRAINLDYLAAVLEETASRDAALAETRILRLDDRLVIALPGDLLFETGRAVLSEQARQALFNMGGVLSNIDNQMVVNGHSDPSPPEGEEYASNWELSVARAVAVANAMRRAGYTEDIIARGYAHGRYSDLADLDEEMRAVLARRVDIVVLPEYGGM